LRDTLALLCRAEGAGGVFGLKGQEFQSAFKSLQNIGLQYLPDEELFLFSNYIYASMFVLSAFSHHINGR